MSDDYLAEMLEEEMKLSREEREKQLEACKKGARISAEAEDE